jgi:HAD superfamily hydrolase (TIGR01549 family)
MIKAFEDLNIRHDISEGKFNECIGLHFIDIFERYDVEVPSFDEFIKIYKSYYFEFIDKSEFYPGVEKTIGDLKAENYKIALLTTKVQDQADKILKHFKIDHHFDLIMGRRPNIKDKPSPEPLMFICNKLNIETKNTMMVGDSEMDIRCGTGAGAKTVGVTYGYRSVEQIKRENPDFIIDGITEINSILN